MSMVLKKQAREAYRKAMGILRGGDQRDARRRANPLLEIAATGEIPPAQYALGESLEFGLGAPVNDRRAFRLYQDSARSGYSPAQYSVGVCFFKGIGVKRNLRKAVHAFRKAAAMRNSYAQHALGRCLLYGIGVKRDKRKGFSLEQTAARRVSGKHSMKLGDVLRLGLAQDRIGDSRCIGIERRRPKAMNRQLSTSEPPSNQVMASKGVRSVL